MSNTQFAEWQKQYQHGTFIIHPSDSVRSILNPLRAKYSPIASSYTETHITLTQPLLRQPTEKDWMRLETIISAFESFTIIYGPLKTWAKGRIIFFEIHPADQILAVRGALHETGLFNLDLPHTDDFIPHMTIQEGYSEGEGQDIIDSDTGMKNYELLNTRLQGGTFHCDQVAWIVPNPKFRFEITRQLSFRTSE